MRTIVDRAADFVLAVERVFGKYLAIFEVRGDIEVALLQAKEFLRA